MLAILPGKTYEYICDRPPVLGIAPKKSDLAWLLSYTEKGVASSSIDEIVDFILHASNKYKGNDNVKKFSREFQAARLCGFMNAIIRSK